MTDKLSIAHWAEEDRPREKMERLGAESLSNAELLAILIGSGTAEKSAVDLMKEVMNGCNNNLNSLGKLSIHDLEQYKGIGKAKAITILAACELGKRRQAARPEERPTMACAADIYQFLHAKMQDLDVEEAWALLLNQSFKLIKAVRISHGGISETAVDVRVVLKEALLCNATVVAIAHNHPSGSVMPSKTDDKLTERMRMACDAMRMHMLDHVIVADGHYYSYHEQGKL